MSDMGKCQWGEKCYSGPSLRILEKVAEGSRHALGSARWPKDAA